MSLMDRAQSLLVVVTALTSLNSCDCFAKVVSHGLPFLQHNNIVETQHGAFRQKDSPPITPVYSPLFGHYDDPYEYENHIPKSYNFGYSVVDSYSGDNYSHREKKTDYSTEGEYRVLLPDGRMQIVSYIADDDGYHATVQYQEDPHYDQQKKPIQDPKPPPKIAKYTPPHLSLNHPHSPTKTYPTPTYKYSPILPKYKETDNDIKYVKHVSEIKKYKYSPILVKHSPENPLKHQKSAIPTKKFKYSPVVAKHSPEKPLKPQKSAEPTKKFKYSPLIGPSSKPITAVYQPKITMYKTKIVLKPSLPHYIPIEEEETHSKEPFKQKPAITLEEEVSPEYRL